MQTSVAGHQTNSDGGSERMVVDPPDLVAAFVDLLALHPEAVVACAGDDGIVTTMPIAVPLVRHRVSSARSVIDMVTPADKVALIGTWERSRLIGGASTIVHLLTDPDQPVAITIVNAMDVYGVHLAMLTPVDGLGGTVVRTMAPIAPRTARVVKTELAMITEIDAATTKILGWRPEEIVGRRSLDFIHPDDQERSISNWMEMLTSPGHDQRVRLRHLAADGAWLWMEITNRNLLNDPDQPRIVAEMLDISDELAAQEALRASEQRLRRLAESLPLGVVQIEADRRISYANASLADVTGAASTDSVDQQFCHITEADRPRFDAALGEVLGGIDQDLAIDFTGSDSIVTGRAGPTRHCTMSMRSLTNDSGAVTGAIVCVSDASDQVRLTVELERRATFDALTGCVNRASIVAHLESCLARLGNGARADVDARDDAGGVGEASEGVGIGEGVAIVFVDLNDFKAVNDDLGHSVGDALLCGVAALLRDAVRETDLVGRIGGDEFLVVCPHVADADEALALAARIDVVLAEGIAIGGTTLVLTASLGVAYTTDPSTSSDRLVADADTKMYIDKRVRKDRAEATGGPALGGRMRRTESSNALRDAIRAQQFEVHYQPIVELPSGSVVGLEALVRWRRGTAIIPAAEFIGLAERSGLITELGRFVLGDALSTAAARTPADHVRWFLNMSPLELSDPSRVADVRAALDKHQLDPRRLVVEITEHSDLANSPQGLRAVNELADLGIGIALDDFGTGYGSLSLLRKVPASYLKFDRSFTADLGHDAIAGHVLETCLDLSARMNLELIAEGVETIEQRDHLIEMGVQLAQGYLFARPQLIGNIFDSSVS